MARRGSNPIVYKVTFPNAKIYIGITSATLHSRKIEHVSKARRGSRLPFHLALLKYENVIWEVIHNAKDYEEVKSFEIKYIEQYDSIKNGYNLTKGGEGTFGYTPSAETRLKSSISHKGYKMPESQRSAIRQSLTGITHKDARKIEAKNLNTGEIMIYTSIAFAEKSGFTKSCIARVCSGNRKSHKGFSFRYL